jgi:hypothetical protein
MIVAIGVPDIADAEVQVALDDTPYRLRTWFGYREQCWFASLASGSGQSLMEGERLTPGAAVFDREVTGAPNGRFFVVDTQNSPQSASGRNDFVTGRLILVYASGADLDALFPAAEVLVTVLS